MHFASVLRTLLALFLLAALPGLRAAPGDEAKAALASGIEEISAALRDRAPQSDLVALLDTLADKHFAFATTTRLAVGQGWRDFSPEQQARAVELFSRLVVRTYAERVTGDTRPQVVYGKALELKGGRFEVPTTTTANGKTYSVAYRLEPEGAGGAGRWRVYDVVAEGVSLIANYRSQFDPIVRKSGASGLIQALELKLANPAAADTPSPAN
jgi:phospholipid transport system substrate-binding protein